MYINKSHLYKAQEAGIINYDQVLSLIEFFENNSIEDDPKRRFTFINFLYYLGSLVIILAMGWFIGNIWDSYGATGAVITCGLYILLFTLTGNLLWKKGYKIPGGLLYTASVATVPGFVYFIESACNLWTTNFYPNYSAFHYFISENWLFMELATVIIGSIYLYFRNFPFLTMPIAYAFWYLSMDLTPLVFGHSTVAVSWDERKFVSLIFGLVLFLIAYFLDKRTREDFSFWFYLFACMTFWGALNFLIYDSNELIYLVYAIINLFMMLISVLFQRRVFMIFGSLGLVGYLFHLNFKFFSHSALFPFTLTVIGLLVIFLGVMYQKNEASVKTFIEALLPTFATKLLPKSRL